MKQFWRGFLCIGINFKCQFQSNDFPEALEYIKIASKLTSIVTILANIALEVEHIFQVLSQYLWVLPQYLLVLSQYLQVLSRWIHPKYILLFGYIQLGLYFKSAHCLCIGICFNTQNSQIHFWVNQSITLIKCEYLLLHWRAIDTEWGKWVYELFAIRKKAENSK